MNVITADDLTKRYGTRRGLESLSLTVGEGCLFGFLGPNGAGKTTLIRVLMGMLRPTAGRASVLGQDCWHNGPALRSHVGFLPGDVRLPPWMTGRIALRYFGLARKKSIVGRGSELAERFDLDLSLPVRRLSRGNRQKLGIVLALAHEPKVLILDEPATSLDPLMQNELHSLLRSSAQAGRTVFFSSHTLSDVDQICDRVAIIRDGRLVADESLETLRRQAGHQVSINWQDDSSAPANVPEQMTMEKMEGLHWRGIWRGPIGPLISWLNNQRISDIAIGRPDLETLFRSYYERDPHTSEMFHRR